MQYAHYSRRIAFISEHASPLALLGGQDAGGQNVYVDALSQSLARLGYAIDIFTRRSDPGAPEVVAYGHGIRIIHLSAGPAEPLLKDELWPYMREFRHSLLAFMLRTSVRYDLIHGHFWMSGWVATEVGSLLCVPVVQTFHALGATKRRHQGGADTSPEERIAVEREIMRNADHVIAHCPSEREELIHDYRIDARHVALIPGGVNIEMFSPMSQAEARARVGLDGDGPVVVYVGRILPRKDIRNVVQALALVNERRGSQPPARLLVVGGNSLEPDTEVTPELGEIQRLASTLGIADQVRCVGMRQPARLREYYSASDVMVTTPWYEPFGLTPLEAMACGRPVIGSAVGGIPSTVVPGRTGLLVPPRDPSALADALMQLFAHPERCLRMGAIARAHVERRFTWPLSAERHARLYSALLAAQSRSRVALRMPALAPWEIERDDESVGV